MVTACFGWKICLLYHKSSSRSVQEELKMNLSIDQIGDLSVIECEGRMMGSEAAFKFRDIVTSRKDARVIVVDLSEVWAVGGAALGILVFLQRWARHHNIQF